MSSVLVGAHIVLSEEVKLDLVWKTIFANSCQVAQSYKVWVPAPSVNLYTLNLNCLKMAIFFMVAHSYRNSEDAFFGLKVGQSSDLYSVWQ